MCRERLHILSFSGDNVCRVRQNVLLRVHMLSPATNCAGATKCAVTHPKFDLTGDRTHDLQIMTVHFMSMRRLL